MIEKDSHKSFPKLMSYAKSYANFSSTLRTLDLPDLHFIQTALTNSEKAKHAVRRLIPYPHILKELIFMRQK